ncbi:kinase-like domain-containing protein [Rhizophagus clarus]|uniref:Kinase-like domain-containing protein n=1 Tax=Rhizophagus clarus TaxID=94130 RepID=A0A8H3LBP7_9GLOM|nr:kinase-like domain-containing protein [Rhizophagus clarus]
MSNILVQETEDILNFKSDTCIQETIDTQNVAFKPNIRRQEIKDIQNVASTSRICSKRITNEKVFDALRRAYVLTNYDISDNLKKRHEFWEETIHKNKTLNKDEKEEAIEILSERYDYNKIINNEGGKRTCEKCKNECLATLYCEHCIRNYLRATFSEWASENNDIDDLIKKCQLESISPSKIIEWIPYNNLENVKYLTKGGFSEIYSANWIHGHYNEWNSEKQQLERYGNEKIIVKKLENVKNANRRWFEEAKSHITISSKWDGVVQSFGLTQDPLDGNYMLVMYQALNQTDTPSKYKEIMAQCWDPDPLKRPNVITLHKMIMNLSKSIILNESNDDKKSKRYLSLPSFLQSISESSLKINTSSLFTSKVYHFENSFVSKNVIKGEQDDFHSKPYDFNITSNIIQYGSTSKDSIAKSSTSKDNIVKSSTSKDNIIRSNTSKSNISKSNTSSQSSDTLSFFKGFKSYFVF